MIAPAQLLTTLPADGLVLLSIRVGGLALVAPVFASRTVPVMQRSAVVVLLTWLLAPVALPAGAAPVLTPATAATEAMIGMALGMGAAVFVGAAEAMGELLAISIGLSGSATLDPMTNGSVPVLGQFSNLLATALLLAVDGHLVMLRALAASSEVIPVAAAVDWPAGLAHVVALGSTLFALGLRFAAPVVAVVLLGNAALAILSRVAPQLNVLGVAFPLQIGLGLLALATTVPMLGTLLQGWPGMYETVAMGLLSAFAGGGR